VGWFGFNGGSTGGADVSIGLINLNTHLSAAAGAAGALILLAILRQPVLLTTTVNASIGGLVGITAGAATMDPHFAVVTGLVSGMIVVAGTRLLESLGLDDVVGAVSAHGLAGAWGTLAAGLFLAGDLFNPMQVAVQLIGILAGFLWAFPMALLMYFLIDRTVGLRASTVDEQRGLDFSEHYEIGYPEFQADVLHKGKG